MKKSTQILVALFLCNLFYAQFVFAQINALEREPDEKSSFAVQRHFIKSISHNTLNSTSGIQDNSISLSILRGESATVDEEYLGTGSIIVDHYTQSISGKPSFVTYMTDRAYVKIINYTQALQYVDFYLSVNSDATVGSYTIIVNYSFFSLTGHLYDHTLTIYLTITALPPSPDFTAAPTSGSMPLAVSFTNKTTGAATIYRWSFGDGATSTEANPSHTYSTAGSFTVALTATGPGGSVTAIKNNYITVIDPNAPVATLTNISWSNFVDQDLDGFRSSLRLHYDPDTKEGSTMSIYEKIYYGNSYIGPWTLTRTTATHTIMGTQDTDAVYVDLAGQAHGIYCWRIEVYAAGKTVPDHSLYNTTSLNNCRLETEAEDHTPPTALAVDAYFRSSENIDLDSDGYSQAKWLYFQKSYIGDGSLITYEKYYYKRSDQTSWTLYCTTTPRSVKLVTDPIKIYGLSHNTYDFKIEIYQDGKTVPDGQLDPINDSSLSQQKLETEEEDGGPVKAKFVAFYWESAIDQDSDTYARSAHLVFELAAVPGRNQTQSVIHKLYYRKTDETTWHLWNTTPPFEIDSGYNGYYFVFTVASHATYDIKMEIFRDGQSTCDDSWTSVNDPDMAGYRLENAIEDGESAVQQNRILTAGWNLVGCYVNAMDFTLSSIVSCLGQNLVVMKNGFGQIYWPSLGIDQITYWNQTYGYQIYLAKADTLVITGVRTTPETKPIKLSNGWNMISYLRDSPLYIGDAVSSVSANLVIAKNGAGQVYWPALGINTIGEMKPGDGYHLFINAAVTLTYPANSSLPKGHRMIAQVLPQTSYYQGYRANTGDNAVLLIKTSGLADGTEIGAFVRGRLIGAGAVERGRALLTLWGDDTMSREKDGATAGDIISLTCWQSDQEIPLQSTNLTDGLTQQPLTGELLYESNAVWMGETAGAAAVPEEYALSQNFPNPFNPITTIKYQLPQPAQVELVVYNLAGARVRTLVKGVRPAGYHEIVWNGRDASEKPVSSGIYWLFMKTDKFDKKIKMSLIK